MRLWPAVVASAGGVIVALGACIEANLTVCPGYDCAPGEVCDLAHHGCVTQGQLDACAGSPDLAPCTSDAVSGECFDQVCLVPGCGNRVVEAGEECDDGNHVSGDGCSLDCTSTEKCGNGVVDAALGEACDDGNAINHDGCNSQCQPETLVYGAIAVRLALEQRYVAYDAARGKLVYAGPDSTWELTGTTWNAVTLTQDVVDAWDAVIYDPNRQRVTGIGNRGGTTIVADWDGTTWTPLSGIAGTPQGSVLAATYDTHHKVIVTIGYSQAQYLDVANVMWGAPFALPASAGSSMVAYDDTAGQLVVLPNSGGATWVLLDADINWISHGVRPPADQSWALVYANGSIVALGGSTGGTPDDAISVWQTNQWIGAGKLPRKRGGAVAWFDASANAIELYGGTDDVGNVDDLTTITPTTITSMPYVAPQDPGTIAYDSTRHQLLYVRNQPHTWSWDGAWHDAGASPLETVDTLVFDPVRAATIATDATSTWKFEASWSSLAANPAWSSAARTYDYANRQVFMVGPLASTALASTGSSWQSAGPGINAASAAFDFGTNHVVALGDSTDGSLSDLVGGHWQPTLSPGFGYAVMGWFARGSIMLVPRLGTGPSERDMFERRDGVFTSRGTLPNPQFNMTSVTEIAHGMLAFAGSDRGAAYVLTLQYTSALPDETCAPGEDADGDGLSGCDDPDCWEQCWPACPYATACP